MKLITEAISTLKTPDEWTKINHPNQKIVGFYGWHGVKIKRSFTDVITEKEFEMRFNLCTTIYHFKGPLR